MIFFMLFETAQLKRRPNSIKQNQLSVKNETPKVHPITTFHSLHSILQRQLSREFTRRAHDAAAGMCARACEVIAVDGRAEA